MKAEKIASLLEAAGNLVGDARWGKAWTGSPRALRTGACRSRRRAEPPVGQGEDQRRSEQAAWGPRSGDTVAASSAGAPRRFKELALGSAQQ